MKAILIFGIALGLAIITYPVKTSAQHLSLGAKAGVGLSNISNFDSEGGLVKRTPNAMVQGGFIMNFMFGDLLGIKAEILFQQKGEVYTGSTYPAKFRIYLNYITLPILVEVSHKFGKITLFGGAGPYVGYALNGKVVAINPSSGDETLTFGKGDFRRFDTGLCFDLGSGYKLGPGNLFLNLRFDLGLMDLSQPITKPSGYKTHDTRNFGISAGYLIPIGK